LAPIVKNQYSVYRKQEIMSKIKNVFVVKFYEQATDYSSWIMTTIRDNLKQESAEDIELINRNASIDEVIENLYMASTTLVYHIDNDIVGFSTLDAFNCIKNLYVFKQYRRKGYGSDITIAVKKYCQTKGNIYCYSKIRSGNIPSKNLFESLGFVYSDNIDNVDIYRIPIVQHNIKYYGKIILFVIKKIFSKMIGYWS
jgi:RimJ/RimL family protein N-acetyltransferase